MSNKNKQLLRVVNLELQLESLRRQLKEEVKKYEGFK